MRASSGAIWGRLAVAAERLRGLADASSCRAAGGVRVLYCATAGRSVDGCDMTTTTVTPTATTTWYPIDDAAKALGVSRRTVQRRVSAGQLRSRTQPDGTSWVEVPLQEDRRSDQLVGLQAVERNEALTDRLMETHQATIEVYRQRIEDLRSEVQTRGRWLWWAGGVAAAGLVAASGFAVLSVNLSARVGATEGHLSATVSQLDQARGQVESQNAALVGLKADLAVSRQATTAATRDADLSRQAADQLAVTVSQLEMERDCLADELAAAADASDMLYLMTGASE